MHHPYASSVCVNEMERRLYQTDPEYKALVDSLRDFIINAKPDIARLVISAANLAYSLVAEDEMRKQYENQVRRSLAFSGMTKEQIEKTIKKSVAVSRKSHERSR